MQRRTFLAALLGPLAFAAPAWPAAGLQTPASALPPMSWSCPMHPEVVDNEAGKCPILRDGARNRPTRARLDLHGARRRHQDGGRHLPALRPRLIRVTKALSFTCPVHTSVETLDPGRCPRCRRTLVTKYTIRPHGDHNPKHGGSFFMVSNNWHLEVTHPAAAVFRLYVYDNYSKPFAPPGLTARITQAPDAAGKPADLAIPFTRSARGYYEARVPNLAVPAAIAAKVRFEAGDKEYQFDFMFSDYSKEPLVTPRK